MCLILDRERSIRRTCVQDVSSSCPVSIDTELYRRWVKDKMTQYMELQRGFLV